MSEVEDFTLDRVMADPDLVLVFREFLKDSFSSENLAFIVEIENYKDLWDQGASDEEIFKRANQIFNKYFSSESKYELNVSGSLIEELKEKMKHPTTIIFNRVQQSIFKLVETDSFPRFLKSDEFKKAVEGMYIIDHTVFMLFLLP
jgi:regulator of G-protein signaling